MWMVLALLFVYCHVYFEVVVRVLLAFDVLQLSVWACQVVVLAWVVYRVFVIVCWVVVLVLVV